MTVPRFKHILALRADCVKKWPPYQKIVGVSVCFFAATSDEGQVAGTYLTSDILLLAMGGNPIQWQPSTVATQSSSLRPFPPVMSCQCCFDQTPNAT